MTGRRAFLGISHTPLLGLNPVATEVSAELGTALAAMRAAVAAWSPDRVVIIGPDHYNGFFNELMPAFCIGTQATAVGDYGTPAGPLRVATDEALALAGHLMDRGFDPAISRRMVVDHGFSQVLHEFTGRGGATWRIYPDGAKKENRVPLAWTSFATPMAADHAPAAAIWSTM